MKHTMRFGLVLIAWNASWLLAQVAPDGTPERAIQDMVLATNPEEIEKHLPLSTLEGVKTLDAEDRRAFEASLVQGEAVLQEHSGIEIPEDGHAFLVAQNQNARPLEVQLTESIATGRDAVLRFSVEESIPVPLQVMVWMRFEDGEWRIRELDTGRIGKLIRFDDPEFVENFRNREQKANESSVTAVLYTLHTALQRYAEIRMDVGIPDDLSQLAQSVDDDDGNEDSNSTGFLTTEMARNERENDGYRFHYQSLRSGPAGAYQITARPVELGRSGRFSYLINESGEIHQTAENRDATCDDPVLGANE